MSNIVFIWKQEEKTFSSQLLTMSERLGIRGARSSAEHRKKLLGFHLIDHTFIINNGSADSFIIANLAFLRKPQVANAKKFNAGESEN